MLISLMGARQQGNKQLGLLDCLFVFGGFFFLGGGGVGCFPVVKTHHQMSFAGLFPGSECAKVLLGRRTEKSVFRMHKLPGRYTYLPVRVALPQP